MTRIVHSKELEAWLSDSDTEDYLLPGYMVRGDNSRDIALLKTILGVTTKACLSDEQQRILHAAYWQGKTKTAIAAEGHYCDSSAICKKLKTAERTLKRQIEFALLIVEACGIYGGGRMSCMSLPKAMKSISPVHNAGRYTR